ncbi:hypothetical protein EXIGLDRAFT_843077 [Exidia glandulosa HHB12029]|uniref:CNH domain-containing protein n=1 Tax=Exidia glandulosa HHB12029 TaxID=1314781 RepID=A0A165CWQ4_EXIGL|nr:hypothetical protein EXIGLDRAFT_843077 [Exidia glandulosa HHB12029]
MAPFTLELVPIPAGRFDISTPSGTSEISCVVPFILKDGRSMIAMGRKDGVEIGIHQQANSRRLVLHIQNVTHVAFIPDSGAFLVLADRELWVYDIESMVPTSLEKQRAARERERLSTRNVLWFRVGQYDGRTLVVFVTKELDGCMFHVLEAMPGPGVRADLRDFAQDIMITNTSAMFFKPYTHFELPGEARDIIFLGHNVLFIVCDRGGGGFRKTMITATEGLTQSVAFPVLDTDHEQLAKHVATAKPLNVFSVPRAGSGVRKFEFLVCYDEFGLYVNVNGELSRPVGDAIIHWGGSVDRLMSHGNHFLLFSSRSIDIRALDTGRVVETLPTQDIEGVWTAADCGCEVGEASGLGSAALSPHLLAYCAMRESGDCFGPGLLQLYGLQTKLDL